MTKILKPEVYDAIFGTKIIEAKTGMLGLMIKTWLMHYADGEVAFGTWVDTKGKRHDTPLEDLCLIEDD